MLHWQLCGRSRILTNKSWLFFPAWRKLPIPHTVITLLHKMVPEFELKGWLNVAQSLWCRTGFKPLLPVLQNLATANCTTPLGCFAKYYAATAYLPAAVKLLNAAAVYDTKHGVLLP